MTTQSHEGLIFPHTVDSTMLAAFRSCPQKFFRTYIQHWKPKAESVHLVAGKAFASGIEAARRAYFEGQAEEPVEGEEGKTQWVACEAGNRELAENIGVRALIKSYGNFQCPSDSAKSLERTAGALEFYYANYPLGADGATPLTFASGRRGIEFSFAEPLPIVHPVSGDPILYTGRLDMVGEFSGGIYGFDEKTASQLGVSWSRQWDLRSQFTGYCWALRQNGINAQGVIVRGVSILKTKYDTQQAITYRAPWEVDRWLEQVLHDLERMKRMWADGWWDYNLDHACSEYGGCSLTQICKSQDPSTWLPMYFEQKVWDPLERRELTMEEYKAIWEPAAE